MEPIKWVLLEGKYDIPPAHIAPETQMSYPWDLMEVGDTLEINRTACRVRQAVWYYKNKKRGRGEFVVRRVTKGTCRVWRIK